MGLGFFVCLKRKKKKKKKKHTSKHWPKSNLFTVFLLCFLFCLKLVELSLIFHRPQRIFTLQFPERKFIHITSSFLAVLESSVNPHSRLFLVFQQHSLAAPVTTRV